MRLQNLSINLCIAKKIYFQIEYIDIFKFIKTSNLTIWMLNSLNFHIFLLDSHFISDLYYSYILKSHFLNVYRILHLSLFIHVSMYGLSVQLITSLHNFIQDFHFTLSHWITLTLQTHLYTFSLNFTFQIITNYHTVHWNFIVWCHFQTTIKEVEGIPLPTWMTCRDWINGIPW